MLLDIAIISYNRTKELERSLSCFKQVKDDRFRIIVYEDSSPNSNELQGLVNKYSNYIHVTFLKSNYNLGYDLNLYRSLSSDSKYILLLSDDDYIDPSILTIFLNYLEKQSNYIIICPFVRSGVNYRTGSHGNLSEYNHDIIYDSILFSGLVFKNNVILSSNELNFLRNSIYIQVYLVAKFFKFGISYFHSPIIIVGNDGENFFGASKSTQQFKNLLDRDSSYSNLYYQEKLIRVVSYVKENLYPSLKFKSNYSIRLISQFIRIRLTTNFLSYYHFIFTKFFIIKLNYYKIIIPIILLLPFIPKFIIFKFHTYVLCNYRKSGG